MPLLLNQPLGDGCYWVSCSRFTVFVEVQSGLVLDAAPIVKKFVGQPAANLVSWVRSLEPKRFKIVKLKL